MPVMSIYSHSSKETDMLKYIYLEQNYMILIICQEVETKNSVISGTVNCGLLKLLNRIIYYHYLRAITGCR